MDLDAPYDDDVIVDADGDEPMDEGMAISVTNTPAIAPVLEVLDEDVAFDAEEADGDAEIVVADAEGIEAVEEYEEPMGEGGEAGGIELITGDDEVPEAKGETLGAEAGEAQETLVVAEVEVDGGDPAVDMPEEEHASVGNPNTHDHVAVQPSVKATAALHDSAAVAADATQPEPELEPELEPLAPILLHTNGGTRALFSAPEYDEGGEQVDVPVLLAGREDLADEGLNVLWEHVRRELAQDGVTVHGEMVVTEKLMELRMGEDDIHLANVTLLDLLALHEGCGLPTPVQLFVTDEPHRFITRFEAIRREVEAAEERERTAEGAEEWGEEWASEEGEGEHAEGGEGEEVDEHVDNDGAHHAEEAYDDGEDIVEAAEDDNPDAEPHAEGETAAEPAPDSVTVEEELVQEGAGETLEDELVEDDGDVIEHVHEGDEHAHDEDAEGEGVDGYYEEEYAEGAGDDEHHGEGEGEEHLATADAEIDDHAGADAEDADATAPSEDAKVEAEGEAEHTEAGATDVSAPEFNEPEYADDHVDVGDTEAVPPDENTGADAEGHTDLDDIVTDAEADDYEYDDGDEYGVEHIGDAAIAASAEEAVEEDGSLAPTLEEYEEDELAGNEEDELVGDADHEESGADGHEALGELQEHVDEAYPEDAEGHEACEEDELDADEHYGEGEGEYEEYEEANHEEDELEEGEEDELADDVGEPVNGASSPRKRPLPDGEGEEVAAKKTRLDG
ncbi:unnamed protein product [Cutaneotrichosporon oleaginosum]